MKVMMIDKDEQLLKGRRCALAKAGAGIAAMLLSPALLLAADPQLTPVASDLNNPRSVCFAPDGSLYVAEAGIGTGDGHGGFGEGIGFTGSITEIRHLSSRKPVVRRIATGLLSIGDSSHGTQDVTGPDGLSIHGRGGIYVIMTESVGGAMADDSQLAPAAAAQLGRLLKFTPSGEWTTIADVGGFNYAWTGENKDQPWAPADQFPDANPYAVLALPGRQYVVDAGANTLNEVRPDGSVRLVAYFPDPLFPPPSGGPPAIPISDSVPTCVAQGPDGFLYVGTLAFGANFARMGTNAPPLWRTLPPQSKIYRVNPNSSKFFLTEDDVWAAGFNPITGCGFSRGAFYVTELMTQESGYTKGQLVRVAVKADGTAGARTYLGVGALEQPQGFAAGPDGAIYVSNRSTSCGDGQVVRVNY